MAPDRLDAIDRRILRELQENADLSVNDLASRVGLSHTPCWRRIKRLEAEGVIRKRVALLDPEKLGLGVQVFAFVTLKEHADPALGAFDEAVKNLPEVIECHTTSGSRDYVLRIVAADIRAYEDYLKRHILTLPGVASVNSTFVISSIKDTTALPL